MNILELSKYILSLKGGKTFQDFYRKNKKDIEKLIKATNFLPKTAFPLERAYCITNDITSVVLCEECDTPVKWLANERKYRNFCSLICKGKSKKIKEKVKTTVLHKYGVENPSQSEYIKQKKIETCRKNHGVDYPQLNKNIFNKSRETMLNKYNCEYALQNDKIKENTKNTNLLKYGAENPSQNINVVEKRKSTIKERYGVNSFSQKHIPKNVLLKLNNKEWLYDQHYNKHKSLLTISLELGINDGTVGRYLHSHNLETQYKNQNWLSETYFKKNEREKTKDSKLYIIHVYNKDEDFIKIGLTTTDINRRFYKFKYNFTILLEIDLPLYSSFLIEREVINVFKMERYIPAITFGGHTECFQCESYSDIRDFIFYLLD